MKVICVIPAYNEEKNIAKVIDAVQPYVNEIVVVDDGSTDKTGAMAKKQKVTVLRHIINRGQGAALQTGNEYALQAGADIVVHIDGDGQFLADEIKDLISPIINEGYDVVFGSRFLQKKSRIPFGKNYIIIPLARLINYFFFNIRLSDPQCGFRALSRLAIEKIKIKQNGMAHCNEILIKVAAEKLKAKEVAVTVIYHDFGQPFGGGVKILKDLFISKLNN